MDDRMPRIIRQLGEVHIISPLQQQHIEPRKKCETRRIS